MLSLRVYLGQVGQRDLVVPGAHEPLVDEATFAAAQVAPRRRAPRSPAAEFHLRGVIRCAGCGFPMTGWNQPRVSASGTVARVRVYRCVRRRHGGACQDRAVVSADAVEALVESAFAPYVRHLRAAATTVAMADDDHGAVDAELARVDERIRRLSSSLRDELGDDLWQDAMIELARHRRQLLDQRKRSNGKIARTTTGWADLTAAERFEVIREGLGAVIVRRAGRRGQPIEQRARIYAAGTVDHLLPSKADGMRLTPFDFDAAELAVSATLDQSA